MLKLQKIEGEAEAEDAIENVEVDVDVMINQEAKDVLAEAEIQKTEAKDVVDDRTIQNQGDQNLFRIDLDAQEENNIKPLNRGFFWA